MQLGIDILLEKIWEMLGLVRVYTKKKGYLPDFGDPLILTHGRHGVTLKSAILQIHKVNYIWIVIDNRGC
jgi:ribosome-interacting GTPase 1